MMAFQREARLPPVPQARYPVRKKEPDTSMLQYTERMRMINTARVNLGDELRAAGSDGCYGSTSGLIEPAKHNGAFLGERRGVQRPDYFNSQHIAQDQSKDVRELPQEAPRNNPRKQRPLSFDDKELQKNIQVIKARRRPLSLDDKELQRNKALNLQFRSKQREAFVKPEPPIVIPTSSSEEDVRTSQHRDGEVRISFVNASDLFDLVDSSSRQSKKKEPSKASGVLPHSKLADMSSAIQIVGEIRTKPNVPQGRTRNSRNPPARKQEFYEHKNSTPRETRVKNIHFHMKTNSITKEEEAIQHAKFSTPEQRPNSPSDHVSPLAVFLQQAVSSYTGQNALTTRPRRAKRMALRKPRLLDIPEDADPHGNRLGPIRGHLPPPSDVSLQAIKELRDFERIESAENRLPVPDTQIKTSRGRNDDRSASPKNGSRSPPNILPASKSTHRDTYRRFDLDIDSLLSASIYPPLPWELEAAGEQPQAPRRPTVTVPEKSSSPKEKAQKKMKKLIFLRDRPEQHYRRDV